ncbi:hypothetical protein NDU88_000024, partial [Pleurodeles waltl]
YQGRKPGVYKAMGAIQQELGLVDAWVKLRKPDPGYTYYSAPHAKLARLDYFLISPIFLKQARIELYSRMVSDHNPLVLDVELDGLELKVGRWTFERGLLKDPEYCEHMSKWITEFLG